MAENKNNSKKKIEDNKPAIKVQRTFCSKTNKRGGGGSVIITEDKKK